MRRAVFVAAVIAGFCGVHAAPAAQQWPLTSLALRTNGSVLTDGDCVRLSLVATDETSGPFVPTVSYAFVRDVTVETDRGRRVEARPVNVARPALPALDHLSPGGSVVLDDTFCFGQGSAPGPYVIRVALGSGAFSASLDTCVEFRPDDDRPGDGCSFAVHGVARQDADGTVAFRAVGARSGLLRLLAFKGSRLVRVIDSEVAATGSREVEVAGSALRSLGRGPVDFVFHDQVSGQSSSLTRVYLGRR